MHNSNYRCTLAVRALFTWRNVCEDSLLSAHDATLQCSTGAGHDFINLSARVGGEKPYTDFPACRSGKKPSFPKVDPSRWDLLIRARRVAKKPRRAGRRVCCIYIVVMRLRECNLFVNQPEAFTQHHSCLVAPPVQQIAWPRYDVITDRHILNYLGEHFRTYTLL